MRGTRGRGTASDASVLKMNADESVVVVGSSNFVPKFGSLATTGNDKPGDNELRLYATVADFSIC